MLLRSTKVRHPGEGRDPSKQAFLFQASAWTDARLRGHDVSGGQTFAQTSPQGERAGEWILLGVLIGLGGAFFEDVGVEGLELERFVLDDGHVFTAGLLLGFVLGAGDIERNAAQNFGV
jgi:hypothetical protein